jgi:hypothetical protein
MLRLLSYGFLLFFSASSIFPAAACSVGTPNQEGSWLITHSDIGLIWTQTDDNQSDYWFDIDATNDASVQNWGPIHAPQGTRVFYVFNNVRWQPGAQHCFEMWARQSPNGCRSDHPSANTCVNLTTPPPTREIIWDVSIDPPPSPNDPGACITTGDNPVNGDHTVLANCNGAFTQQWWFENGMIKNVLGKCLDVPGGTSVLGTLVILHDCWGGPMQKWTFEQAPGFNYGILYDLNGNCLYPNGNHPAIAPCGAVSLHWWDLRSLVP